MNMVHTYGLEMCAQTIFDFTNYNRACKNVGLE